ncbi:MAG: acyl-CoA synthetase [Deltaproteobacteria bacterium]|nr:MAG: acyl-CoA synthetase [Deltaproteobacteria bacterium]
MGRSGVTTLTCLPFNKKRRRGNMNVELNLIRRFNVGDVLKRTALRYPEKTAIIFEGKEISYSDLEKMTNRVAHVLLEKGVKRGDVVGILALNSPEYAALWFAAARIGALLAPINAGLEPRTISFIVEKSKPKVVFVDSLLAPLLKAVPQFETVPVKVSMGGSVEGYESLEELISSASDTFPEVYVESDDPTTLLFTSGTESLPKGVLNSHANWYAALIAALADLEFRHDQRTLLSLPLFHSAGLYVIFASVACGCTGFMTRKVDVPQILEGIQKHRLTYIVFPATVYQGLLQVPGIEKVDFSSVTHAIVFQYLPKSAFLRWKKLIPGAVWFSYWGQSEMTPLGACIKMRTEEEMEKALVHPDPIGSPLLPVELRIVDEEGNDVPPGGIGEMVTRSPAVMLGYMDEPEKTGETFRGGWHHTGDMGRIDENGILYFVDRVKDMIKTGGENVSSQEVEEVVASHPKVTGVAVIGMPDPKWIEAVTAVVTVKEGETLTEEELVSYCRERLAGFKVPKRVIILDSLPTSPTGKVLKRELRKTLLEKEGGEEA